MTELTLQELEELNTLSETFKLHFYAPYDKQKEFHASMKRERLFMAGNQLGKTWAGAFEVAMHLTGLYPDWWTGRRMERANKWWVAGESGESTRDNPQRLLLGDIGEFGTGAIPKDCLGKKSMARGVADLVDHIAIKHVSGGWSHLFFKSYGKGREKWQGETIDGLWCDEEPPLDVYTEGLTRTNKTTGPVLITFTPLKGMSSVVAKFLTPDENDEGAKDREVINMTIHDVDHYTDEQVEQIIAQYPSHEREARSKGIPMLGSGRIFPVAEEVIQEELEDIPQHWPRIVGMDFGWGDHPTAAVWLAYDKEGDVIHLYDAYREKEGIPIIHAAAIKSKGLNIPVAWPHDGLMHDKGSGVQICDIYRNDGLNMIFEHAKYPDNRGFGVEASVTDILQRMQTGRFKVAKHLQDWWEEFRMYHRKDGKIIKERDDLMSATRYAVMMLRYATVASYEGNYGFTGKIEYPNLGIV